MISAWDILLLSLIKICLMASSHACDISEKLSLLAVFALNDILYLYHIRAIFQLFLKFCPKYCHDR